MTRTVILRYMGKIMLLECWFVIAEKQFDFKTYRKLQYDYILLLRDSCTVVKQRRPP